MKYYYQTDSAGLLEIFKTECVSVTKVGMIRLSNGCPRADYVVEIDSSLLYSKYKRDVGASGVEYSLPIFLTLGKVRFIFANDDLKKSFESSAMLMLTIKCMSKYKDAIVISDCETVECHVDAASTNINGNAIAYIVEKRFNLLKGAVIAYVCASCASDSSEGIELKTNVRRIKNDIAGLHTQVMMDSHCPLDVESFMHRIECVKAQYIETHAFKTTNLFDILRQLFRNMVEIVADKNASEPKFETLRHKLQELEDQNSIQEMRSELQQIKDMEVENGRRNGKTRTYFKKGTVERARKDELKREIKQFEESSQVRELLDEMEHLNPDGHESAIRTLFERMSDVTASILESIDTSSASGTADLSQLLYKKSKLSLGVGALDKVEMAFFNIALENAMSNPFDVSSELALMNLISESAKRFMKTEEGRTDKGCAIVECLREFWKYKQHKTFSFSIPDDMPVFGSTMAFFVKPLGSEQLDRFMLNRRFAQKKFGFMLWGTCVGFAGLPKTFTTKLYENSEMMSQTDSFLAELIPQVIADAEMKIDVDF